MEEARAFQLIEEIDGRMALLHKTFFDPAIFSVLDDVNTGRRELNLAQKKINEPVWLRLQTIASAVYSGNIRRGEASSFYDVVSCLGTQKTKLLIMMMGIQQSALADREVENIFARNFSTSVMADVLARQFGFRDESAQRAELGGLFLGIGRLVIALYRKDSPREAGEINDVFINTYHRFLAAKIIKRFALPDFLSTIISAQSVLLEENSISLPGVVYLARDMVRSSFQKYGNRLVIRCNIPRPAIDVSRTLESIIRDKFHAAGLEKYLVILRVSPSFLARGELDS
jgi:hypothetical protein